MSKLAKQIAKARGLIPRKKGYVDMSIRATNKHFKEIDCRLASLKHADGCISFVVVDDYVVYNRIKNNYPGNSDFRYAIDHFNLYENCRLVIFDEADAEKFGRGLYDLPDKDLIKFLSGTTYETTTPIYPKSGDMVWHSKTAAKIERLIENGEMPPGDIIFKKSVIPFIMLLTESDMENGWIQKGYR